MPNSFASGKGNHPGRAGPNLGIQGKEASVVNETTVIEDTSAFVPWTIPAYEMRRLIRQARARFPTETWEIEGAILPGAEGDEVWRATAAAARFLVRREVSADGAERIACVDPESESGGACEPFVAERLLSPPSDRWAAVLMRKLLLQMPYPIVDGFVMRSNRGIHCMGE